MKSLAVITNYSGDLPDGAVMFFKALRENFGKKVDLSFYSYDDILIKDTFDHVLTYDALILSSGFFDLADLVVQQRFAHEIELVRQFSGTILGMCFGHHIIGKAFGLEPTPTNYGDETINNPDNIDFSQFVSVFKPSGGQIDYVEGFSPSYLNVISGLDLKLQFMQHKTKPFYGFGFYPDLNSPEQAQSAASLIVQLFIGSLIEK